MNFRALFKSINCKNAVKPTFSEKLNRIKNGCQIMNANLFHFAETFVLGFIFRVRTAKQLCRICAIQMHPRPSAAFRSGRLHTASPARAPSVYFRVKTHSNYTNCICIMILQIMTILPYFEKSVQFIFSTAARQDFVSTGFVTNNSIL